MYYWNDGGTYRGEWKADRMNGVGRLVKGGIDIVGIFFADHFVNTIEDEDLGTLKNYLYQ